jgi:prolyl 4-hydroxylase
LHREHTLLIYLNDVPVESGGATKFQRLNITVQPNKNSALYFYNLHKNGIGHEMALHSGEPIIGNITKWAINCWIRTALVDIE